MQVFRGVCQMSFTAQLTEHFEAVQRSSNPEAIIKYGYEVAQLCRAVLESQNSEDVTELLVLLREQLMCTGEAGTGLLEDVMFDVIPPAWDCAISAPDGIQIALFRELLKHASSFCSPREVVLLVLSLWDRRKVR